MAELCFFIGFMGAGKTCWGQRVAEQLNIRFVDLDAQIELGTGSAIGDIFRNAGESGFRELEHQYLRQTTYLAPAIIAVGGGTPCFFDNMDWMNRNGLTIYLSAPVKDLVHRLRQDRISRPLLSEVPEHQLEAHISALLEKRAPFYRQAQVEINTAQSKSLVFAQLTEIVRPVFFGE